MPKIPGGAYHFADIKDNDGLDEGRYHVQVESTNVHSKDNGDASLVFTFRVCDGPCANMVQSVFQTCFAPSDPSKQKMKESIGKRQTKSLGVALGFAEDYDLNDTDDFLNKTCTLIVTKNAKNPSFMNYSYEPWIPGTSAVATTPRKKASPVKETVSSDDDVPW